MVGGKNLNKVLVFGATGAQGSPVVKQLLAQGIDVRGVSRDAEKVKAAFGDTVEAVDADLSDLNRSSAHSPVWMLRSFISLLRHTSRLRRLWRTSTMS
jgi:nucleoside-diphosphate-sugar epimerase